MNFVETLVEKSLNDPYLVALTDKLEIMNASVFLSTEDGEALSPKEYRDLLAFADILCRASKAEGRNKAYRIIAALFDLYHEDDLYKRCSSVVLTKLGNFPSLALAVGEGVKYSTSEILLERAIKEVFQESSVDGKIFTDAQYRLYDKLIHNNHYSFSGPTSFGKSFIMSAFIKHIVETSNVNDNIVVLVPTRALINQVTQRLKIDIAGSKYMVLAHPTVPYLYRKAKGGYVFVFTPERWISYLSQPDNPTIAYMFIDEAQKIVSNNDSRAPLYYHAIHLAQRRSIKLFFASPNIPNAEVFLQLFEKSIKESMRVQDVSVAQNRYFLDFIEGKTIVFLESGKQKNLSNIAVKSNDSISEMLIRLGKGHKNIVYCNSVSNTIEYARRFASRLPNKASEKIAETIDIIKRHIHKDYYLIDCLKKGVAFHFGRLPQRIREKIEWLFSEKEIDYMFCTSTLLEGVNLPAKNIFILADSIGLSHFSDIDFWNLAGRAGRLSKELSGNVICVRMRDNDWKDIEKTKALIGNKEIAPIEPVITSGKKSFYKNLANSLEDKSFTRKNPTSVEKEIWDQFANVTLIHHVQQTQSVLHSKFLESQKTARSILDISEKKNNVPIQILEQCSTIKAQYQNEVLRSRNPDFVFPEEVTHPTCLAVLQVLYNAYHWSKEESSGRRSLVRGDSSRLSYWAALMNNWINERPLNLIINNLLKYYEDKSIFINGSAISFESNNRMHINHVINELISDIDTGLRFHIKNYVLNYYLLLAEKGGVDAAGPKWADYLEYGTTRLETIELQNIGIPRHLATVLLNDFFEHLCFQGGLLVGIDYMQIHQKVATNPEYSDVKEELDKALSALVDMV